MQLSSVRLKKSIIKLAIRYHEKTNALNQSMLFITEAEIASKHIEPLKRSAQNFDKYLNPHGFTTENHFAGMLLINLISETEMFFVDVVKEVISYYPQKVGKQQFPLNDILEMSKDELVLRASEEFLNKIMYKKPKEYLESLGELISIDMNGFTKDWNYFIEAKARRDLGVHNGWAVNSIYTRKISEIGIVEEKSSVVPDYKYITTVMNSCDRIVTTIHTRIDEKYSLKKL
jgi:hypothetical protein